MKTLLSLCLVLFSFSLFAQDKYYGAKSTEAILRFEGKIELTPGLAAAQKKEAIDSQVQHLIGYFQSESFLDAFRFPGVLGQKYKIILKGQKIKGDMVEVSYHFEGKTNFHRSVFRNGRKTQIPLSLPYNIDKIYELGVVRGKNLCSDEHYNSEGDFFYFWDPDKDECPLKGNTTDVLRINGTLDELENTTSTYPEYDRLYQKDKIKVAVFIGYIDGPTNRDSGAYSYRGLKEKFTDLGFELKEEKKLFRHSGQRVTQGVNYLATFSGMTKTALGTNSEIEIQLMLAETEMDNRDSTFHKYLIEAYENADIIAYDGHSGLGGNLDLNSLPTVNFKRNYQIIFFNGCSSYPYYNQNYFAAKPGGSKNLDIITAGLPTLTSTSEDNMMAFLTPFLKGYLSSWQTLMNRLEASNGEETTYLMGVNGDEDNQFRPR
ncbi:MAG: hypothetical protein K2P81_13070 [Bacteriovoracaceae bacterium]|nr:hypothetical protein [Bacteriovoracaceae bacterium]